MRTARILGAVFGGTVAWHGLAIIADYLFVTQWNIDGGARYALLGIIQFLAGTAAVVGAIKLAGLQPARVGFTTKNFGSDAAIGVAVALVFAVLQFLVIIPATGGAERSDVVANAAQIGEGLGSLSGVLALAILGSSAEEFLFRGLMLGGIALALKGGITGRVAATVLVVVLFALSHGYQGWAGIVDTGIYGGLVLSLLYWWRGGRLAAPVFAHIGWNLIAALGIYFLY